MKNCRNKFVSILVVFVLVAVLLPPLPAVKAAAQEEVITIIDDAEEGTELNQIEYTNFWKPAAGAALDYEGTEHWTNRVNWKNDLPSFKIRFKGNGIEVYGKKENTASVWVASIDGNTADSKEFDPYNIDPQYQEKIVSFHGLEEGEHVLEIQITDRINAMADQDPSLNYSAVLDYIKVFATEEVNPDKTYQTFINDHDMGNDVFEFNYSQGWNTSSGYPNSFYKGDEHYSKASKDFQPSVELKFYGSKIELFGVKDALSSYYDISIDGGPAEQVNPYHPDRMTKQSLYVKDGLTEGEHTLKFTVTYNKPTESSDYNGEIDYAVATHKAIPASDVSFDKEQITVEEGLTEAVTITTEPHYATSQNLRISIADEKIAAIDEHNIVKGVSAGNTTLVAELEGTNISKSIPVTVYAGYGKPKASFQTPYRHSLQKNYDQIAQQTQDTWNDTAWRNDVTDAKIVVSTRDSAVNNIEIETSDFANGNDVIRKDNVDVRWINETLANIGRGQPNAPKESFPDVIHKGGKVNIEANTLKSAWISVTIPEDAKPGTYTGNFKIKGDGIEEPQILTYSIEVLDLSLPNVKDTDTQIELWQHPYTSARYYGVEPFSEEHKDYLRPQMIEYRDMGGRALITNIVEEAWNHQSYDSDPTMVTWTKRADGTFSFDYSDFDAWVAFNEELGVIDSKNKFGQIKCYSIVPWANQITYYDEAADKIVKTKPNPGSDEWKGLWTAFLTDFMRHQEQKGWLEITYISMDERSMSDLEKCVELIHSIKNEDGYTFKIASAMNYKSGNDYSFLDQIDDISIGSSYINDQIDDMRKLSEHRRDLGLLTTIYNCTGDYPGCYTISDMADNAWSMWYSLKHRTDGFMRWSWDGWVEDPLTDVSYRYWEPGDPWVIYPAERDAAKTDDVYYETPRYKMLKQGIRDINKAKYLMGLSDDYLKETRTLVESLALPKKGGNGYGSAVAATEADRDLTENEVLRMRNGIDQIAKKVISEHVPPVDKTNLNQAIDQAERLLADGALAGVDDSARIFFEESLAAAKDTAANAKATQEEVDTAIGNLHNATEMLTAAMMRTVIFDTAGGNPIEPLTNIAYGTTIPLPTPARSGRYRFDGWYDGTTLYTNEMTITSNVTLTARWTYIGGKWVKNSNGWWYENYDGSWPANGWLEIEDTWYYFNASGYMMTGWVSASGSWYYLNSNGSMATGWVLDGDTWYYLKENGAMVTGWLLESDTWYYLTGNGAMASGWLYEGRAWYYLNNNGSMAAGWLKDGRSWYYLNENGSMSSGWIQDGSTWYYLNSNGTMATGWLLRGNVWYYLNHSGGMETGWLRDRGKWYYLNSDGAMASGWIMDSGLWYYLKGNGVMATGPITIKGQRYHLENSGAWDGRYS